MAETAPRTLRNTPPTQGPTQGSHGHAGRIPTPTDECQLVKRGEDAVRSESEGSCLENNDRVPDRSRKLSRS